MALFSTPEAIKAVIRQLQESRHRALCVIAGDQSWCWESVRSLSLSDVLVVTESNEYASFYASVSAVINRSQVREVLGAEYCHAIYDAHEGMNPDSVAAVAGTITAGGLLVLLTPLLDHWPSFNDPDYARITVYPHESIGMHGEFLRFWVEQIRQQINAVIWQQDGSTQVPDFAALESINQAAMHSSNRAELLDHPWCASNDQALAVQAVKRVAQGHRNRPLVIMSNRGRGKTSALGIALAELVAERALHPAQSLQAYHILICAPHASAVSNLFAALDRNLILPNTADDDTLARCYVLSGKLNATTARVDFIVPETLFCAWPSADLVLIDEAAALPVHLLERITVEYSRVCFSTTVDGYEGSGRGFELRFQDKLAQLRPQYRRLKMHAPVRWNDADPLEEWLLSSCLMQTNSSEASDYSADLHRLMQTGQLQLQSISQASLVDQPELLLELFNLFTAAHYRTTPDDARNMLDGPNIRTLLMLDPANERVLGTVLLAEEGAFEDGIASAIAQSKRRVHGHLAPQSLAQQCGFPAALKMRSWRVIRIAVQPSLQNHGLGSTMLNQLFVLAQEASVDLLATSFSVNPGVLSFWQKNRYRLVRLGLRREASSGCHSGLMLQPISASSAVMCAAAQDAFQNLFIHLLLRDFSTLDQVIVAQVLGELSIGIENLSDYDAALLTGFADNHLVIDSCWPALVKLTIQLAVHSAKADGVELEPTHLHLLIAKVLQNCTWEEAGAIAGSHGKKRLTGIMQELVSSVMGSKAG